jgi:hypothetical protein
LLRVRDEDGAVLAIVAISFICLIGMLVLTFDLGRGVALKRNMVNGADAAALAAAMECGRANGEAAARQEAADLLGDNNAAATILPGTAGFRINPGPAQCSGVPSPDPDHNPTVTVTVTVPQEYFFAPIFGINNGTVVASATAEWTTGLTNPAPLKLEALKVDECLENGSGSSCFIAFTSDGPGSQWGWLNFPEGWPVEGEPNPMNCTSQKGGTKDLESYIGSMGGVGGSSSFLPTLWNIPVWVCAEGGFVSDAQAAIRQWINAAEDLDPRPIVSFPVVAPAAAPCPAEGCWPTYTGSRASYPVVRFQGFYFENLWSGKQEIRRAGVEDDCGFPRNYPSSVFCIELTVVDDDSDPSSGTPIVRLVG